MNRNQLDSRIEAFMARKMKQFPEIENRYKMKERTRPTKRSNRQPQVWLLNPGIY